MLDSPTASVRKAHSLSASKSLVQGIGIASFVFLTAIGAQLEIHRVPVPYTLQTWFVIMAGALLGKRNGAISMFIYLLFGMMGVPVFSQWGYGIARIIGPTGGYLLSFPIAAFVVGYLVENRRSFLMLVLSMMAGMILIYLIGIVHLNFVYFHNWKDSILQGLLIFSWWDGIKIIAAAGIVHQVKRWRG